MPLFKKKTTTTTQKRKAVGPVKITWLKKVSSLIEVYSAGLEYCFVSRDHKQCCPFVFCKDFLQDAIMAMHHGSEVEIYGFNFSPKTCEPVYMNRMRIALANSSDAELGERIPNVVDFLRQIEAKLRLIRTTVRPVANPPKKYKKGGIYLLESSNRWMLSPPMVSFYSLAIRMGFVHKKGEKYTTTIQKLTKGECEPYQTHDHTQMKQAQTGVDKILKHGYAKIFWKDAKKNFPKINTSTMHNSMGICSFASGYSKDYVKHWHRDLTKAAKKKDKK